MPQNSFVEAARAVADLGEGEEAEVADVLASFLPVDGAAVSTLGETLGSETVAATDALAARLDEIQFDLGEGPCWDALANRRPVLEADLRLHGGAVWPGFAAQLAEVDVGAIFAFPLTVGRLDLGAIDLYRHEGGSLTQLEVSQASMMAALVSRLVLRRALRTVEEANATTDDTEFSRRVVHQATGITLAQLRIAPDDALLLIQGHAFAAGRSMMEVAEDIVEGRLRLDAGADGIEEEQ